jgi:hypothetical protein
MYSASMTTIIRLIDRSNTLNILVAACFWLRATGFTFFLLGICSDTAKMDIV